TMGTGSDHKSFIVEQFRWNKWVKIASVVHPDKIYGLNYSYEISDLHSGENIFRVKQLIKGQRGEKSERVTMNGIETAPILKLDLANNKISFSRDTSYEIYNAFGNFITKGYESEIDCTVLEAGSYFMNYDREMTKFSVR
ncbi:MAG: hypothetical protein JKX74_06080, partial [Flavobacteriales bacterium]|nr:hypothetical protein [Flavobacteriales bacterium]